MVRYWRNREEGRIVWRYLLDKIYEPTPTGTEPIGATVRRLITSERIVRDAGLAARIKRIYGFSCQVCGENLQSPSGLYVEAAHVKPLGTPDDGPDMEENLLCLCPNHHKLLDTGGIVMDGDMNVIHLVDLNVLGPLTVSRRHRLTQEYLAWHRQRWA